MQVALSPRRRLGTFRLGETVAHQVPTGFWYVWQPDIDLLDDEFLQIWNGEGGTFAACDRIYFAFMEASGVDAYWRQDTAHDLSYWASAGLAQPRSREGSRGERPTHGSAAPLRSRARDMATRLARSPK